MMTFQPSAHAPLLPAILKAWIVTVMFVLTPGALAQGTGATTEIENLQPPRPRPAPRPPEDADSSDLLDQDLRRKRQQRQERNKALYPPPPDAGKKRQEGLLKEALQERPRRFFLELSLYLTTVQTQSPRTSYTVDPAVHINAVWRHNPNEGSGRVQPFYGLRVAPFTGTGLYENHAGAYGLTYFGPMIGVGKLSPVILDRGSSGEDSGSGEPEAPAATGWLVSGGVAAVSRMGHGDTLDPGDDSHDFGSKAVTFDPPGIWAEARYLKILYGALGYNIACGVQTARGKVFVYAGAGTTAWY